jgi:hypothetical protein
LTSTIAHSDAIVWYPNPPRTGGLAFQTGSLLNCVAGRPTRNMVEVIDKGAGAVLMSWNFGRPQAFTGVSTVVIQAERAGTDRFSFEIPHGDPVTATASAAGATFAGPGPSAGSTGIALSSHQRADSRSYNAAGHLLAHLRNEHRDLAVETNSELMVAAHGAEAVNLAKVKIEHDGFAVLKGSELTVTVDRPTTNVVEITELKNDAGVQAAWNGGGAHTFTGVATIVVETRNARKDQVTLSDASP